MDRVIRVRVQNFVDAVARPGKNERLVLLGALLKRLGYSSAAGEPRERAQVRQALTALEPPRPLLADR